MAVADSHYKLKFKGYPYCVYCGQIATCLDHVFPLSVASLLNLNYGSVRKELFQGLNKVPCCYECNTLIVDFPFVSIAEKRKAIQKLLKKRYKSILKAKYWNEDELFGMSKNLKESIKQSYQNRRVMEQRVNWPVLSHYTHSRNR